MLKKRKKIINIKKQFKILIPVLALYLAASACIIILISYSSNIISSDIDQTIEKLSNSIKTEDDIVNSFIFFSKKIIGKEYELETDKITSDHEKSITLIRNQTEVLKNLSHKYMMILYIIIGTLSIIAVILIIIIINLTHKIYGPVHVMTEHLNLILQGKSIEERPLRKGDDLTELYSLIIKANKKLETKSHKKR